MPDFNNPPLGYLISEWLFAHTPLSDLFYKKYLVSLGLRGDERILEFGSGGGIVSRYLSVLLSRGGRLTCVDISPRWVLTAKERLAGIGNIEFLLGDVRKLDLKDGSYDGVVVHFVLHDVEEQIRDSVLKALFRKLKRGGSFFVREPTSRITVREIDDRMKKAGLKKESAAYSTASHMGQVYEAVFVKK